MEVVGFQKAIGKEGEEMLNFVTVGMYCSLLPSIIVVHFNSVQFNFALCSPAQSSLALIILCIFVGCQGRRGKEAPNATGEAKLRQTKHSVIYAMVNYMERGVVWRACFWCVCVCVYVHTQ